MCIIFRVINDTKMYVRVYRLCVCVWGGGGTGNQQVMITGEDIQITLSKCLEIMSIHCLRCLF